jgi:hypothetical protein
MENLAILVTLAAEIHAAATLRAQAEGEEAAEPTRREAYDLAACAYAIARRSVS